MYNRHGWLANPKGSRATTCQLVRERMMDSTWLAHARGCRPLTPGTTQWIDSRFNHVDILIHPSPVGPVNEVRQARAYVNRILDFLSVYAYGLLHGTSFPYYYNYYY